MEQREPSKLPIFRPFAVYVGVNAIDPEATAEHLRFAILYLLEKAKQFPPDSRFDWDQIYVDIPEGTGTGTGTGIETKTS